MASLISFSGGRSSAMMTKILIDGGLVNADDFIVFADTGMERAETYQFIEDCEKAWCVKIHKLKRTDDANPFETLIREKVILPNQGKRVCTEELKVNVMQRFMFERGFTCYRNYVGIRYDEPNRWAKLNLRNEENEAVYDKWLISKRINKRAFCVFGENKMPLFDLRLTSQHVRSWWSRQDFDLQLESYQGNCDLCFLKGKRKLVKLIREYPPSVEWWIEMEKLVAARAKEVNQERKEAGLPPLAGIDRFRLEYTYEQLKELALNQLQLDLETLSDFEIECACNVD